MVYLLSGYKRSGKDTAAKYLIETQGFERRAFADSLKDDVAKFLGVNRMDMDDDAMKERAIIERPVTAYDEFSKMTTEFLYKEFRTDARQQAISYNWLDNKMFATFCDGMVVEHFPLYWTPRAACIFIGSVGRSFNTNHWVDRALSGVRTQDNIVVSDFRYKSEYNRIIDLYGKENITTVRINRFDDVNSTDPSERNLDDFTFDYIIDNKGSMEEYFNNLQKVFG